MDDLLSSERSRSCGNPGSILHDEEFRLCAREFVHENAYQRGQPNMTLNDFRNRVESSYDVPISIETARAWLRNLGFDQKSHHKSVYFDGDDVTEYRTEFVKRVR